jgi:acyl transferase domain-containing protein
VRELVDTYELEGVQARRIPVDYASHSSHVERIREDLAGALAGVRGREPRVPFYSTVDGRWLEAPDIDAAYWYRNLRQPVRFEPAVRTLIERGHRVFVEVSPHPVLTISVEQALDQAGVTAAVVTGTLRREEGDLRRFVASLAALHVRGVPVDWSGLLAGGRRTDLPTYAFQRQRYWLDAVPARREAAAPPAEEAPRDDGRREALARRLDGLPPAGRTAALLEVVRGEAAAILGHETADAVQPEGVLFEAGFTSLMAVELRNRLNGLTGLELPVMLLFDHPTPAALAAHLTDVLSERTVEHV